MATYGPLNGDWSNWGRTDLAETGTTTSTSSPSGNKVYFGEKSSTSIPNQISIDPRGIGNRTEMSIFSPAPKLGPAPAAPDLGNLRGIQSRVERQKALKQALAEFDELEASTLAMGSQTAENAGRTYSNRLMQSGINPVASGVVAAQAKLPVYGQLADIGVKREATRLDAVQKADAMAATIASKIADIQMGYTKMLADYNQQKTAYELDLTKFNAAQSLEAQQFTEQQKLERAKLKAAELAARSSTSGRGAVTDAFDPLSGRFTPGYIPNSGALIPATVNGVPFGTGQSVFSAW